MVLTWLRAMAQGNRIAVYCSDVSGAFDRVPADRLLDKLRVRGVHERILAVLRSWLAPRSAAVVVDASESEAFARNNMVYQGTVLGPPLWNTHYADSAVAVAAAAFEELVYADDLNAYRPFPAAMDDSVLFDGMEQCQKKLA